MRIKNMSIRHKISLVLGVVLASIVLLNAALAWFFILPSFKRVEISQAQVSLNRFLEAYDNELNFLSLKLSDWANWNDSYNFVVDRNAEYINSNLQDTSLENLKINFVIIVNKEEEIVYWKGYDFHKKQAINDFEGWEEHMRASGCLTDYEENVSKKGLIVIAGKPAFFVSHPILTSNAEGPSRGTLVFARYFDTDKIKQLAELTKLNLQIDEVWRIADPEKQKIYESMLASGNSTQISANNPKHIESFLIIKDYYDQPTLFLSADINRDVFQRGIRSIIYFVSVSAASGLIILLITSLFMEFIVLRRISRFNFEISEITRNLNPSRKITVSGNDEISNMSKSVNIMMEALKNSYYKIKTEHQKFLAYLKIMKTMLVTVDFGGKITFANERARDVLEVPADEEIIGKNWFENFIPEKNQKAARDLFKKIMEEKDTSGYCENVILTRNKKEKLIAWRNAALKDGLGNTIGIIFSGDDITEKKEKEEMERKQSLELKRVNDLMIGRELRIIELKKKVKELEEKLAKK